MKRQPFKKKDCQARLVKLCGIFIKHITSTWSAIVSPAGETIAHDERYDH